MTTKTFKQTAYSEKLQDPRWQKKRLQVLERDNFTCTLCSDSDSTLHVHHEKYYKNPWDVEMDDLKTICCDCHSVIEFLKKGKEVDKILKIQKRTNLNDSGCTSFILKTISPIVNENCVIVVHKCGNNFQNLFTYFRKPVLEAMLSLCNEENI